MGDRKPSDFYRYLKQLAGTSGTVSDALLTKLWLRRLPSVINVALIPFADREIIEVSAIADRIWEASGQNISSVNTDNYNPNYNSLPSSSSNDSLSNVRNDIQELRNMFKEFMNLNVRSNNNNNNSNFRARSRSRSHSRNKYSNTNNNNNNLCYYHKKFADRARKCSPFCLHFTTFNETKKSVSFPKNR